MGIVPAAGLAQGIDPPGVAEVPVGTELPAGTGPARGTAVLWVPGTGRAEVPAGTVRVRGTDPVAGIGRSWAGRGIGRFGAVPSCGCS